MECRFQPENGGLDQAARKVMKISLDSNRAGGLLGNSNSEIAPGRGHRAGLY
jgi:hypothetical protein